MEAQTERVFIGEQREIEALDLALAWAIAGRAGVVLLAGEPGIGKTRTAQECPRTPANAASWHFGDDAQKSPAHLPTGRGCNLLIRR